jgi:hypothetical protein
MPTTAGTLAALSAAVAGGWGRNDGSSICRYFLEHMRQDLGGDG